MLPFSLGLYWDLQFLFLQNITVSFAIQRFGTNAWNRNKIRQKVTGAHHYYLTFEIKELIKYHLILQTY